MNEWSDNDDNKRVCVCVCALSNCSNQFRSLSFAYKLSQIIHALPLQPWIFMRVPLLQIYIYFFTSSFSVIHSFIFFCSFLLRLIHQSMSPLTLPMNLAKATCTSHVLQRREEREKKHQRCQQMHGNFFFLLLLAIWKLLFRFLSFAHCRTIIFLPHF